MLLSCSRACASFSSSTLLVSPFFVWLYFFFSFIYGFEHLTYCFISAYVTQPGGQCDHIQRTGRKGLECLACALMTESCNVAQVCLELGDLPAQPPEPNADMTGMRLQGPTVGLHNCLFLVLGIKSRAVYMHGSTLP